jgi:hypothetical protein
MVSVTLERGGVFAKEAQTEPESGSFRFLDLPPGDYAIHVWRRGFGSRVFRGIPVQPWDTTHAGEIELEPLSCDAPGADCPNTVGKGQTIVKLSCVADVSTGIVLCDDNSSRYDVAIETRQTGGLFLVARIGALVHGVDLGPTCEYKGGSDKEIRIDGLDYGDDLCAVKDGQTSRIFVIQTIGSKDTQVPLWFVTVPTNLRKGT